MNTSEDSRCDRSIAWFREASPYIRAHRDATLVIAVPGNVIAGDTIDTLVHDLALLHHLGLRLVVCYGLRAQVDEALADDSRVVEGRRVTDDLALQTIVSEAGRVRTELEARLSAGLPNTPMSGAHLSVSSGNLIVARPFGVRDGVDFRHTGSVREVRREAISDMLDATHVVLIGPIGYSLTGDIFNLTVDEIAAHTATALGADKLVYLVDSLPVDAAGTLQRELDSATATTRSTATDTHDNEHLKRVLGYASAACDNGVERVHLLDQHKPDALLSELFTRDGSGTLITAERWESVRPASINDLGGIMALVAPLQDEGALASRSREQLELDIADFVVSERDGTVVACAALYLLDDGNTAEIGCVATHPDYRGEGRADAIVSQLEARAKRQGCAEVFLLSTRAGHWFIERGYTETGETALPPQRRDTYNRQRSSKVYVKSL